MKSKKKILLEIKKLCVSIAENSKNKKLIKSVSFNIKKNEIVGLIGESRARDLGRLTNVDYAKRKLKVSHDSIKGKIIIIFYCF